MKIITTFILSLLLLTNLYGQKNKEEQAIVDEGKVLYRSEMASWYGTDIFLETFPDKREQIGGYFSYAEKGIEKCVFFSNEVTTKILATISFDSTYDVATAIIDTARKEFTPYESEIYTIRAIAFDEINKDTFFKTYRNTNLNLIPLIDGKSKKVFVLTGPQNTNVVIFGNDYLLSFDRKNKLISKKQLHRNIIPIEYSDDGKINGQEVSSTMHSHLPQTGELITSTDICTLMLYEKFAKWTSHIVVSETSMCIWTCASNSLAVVPKATFKKINEDQEKRHKK